MKKVIRLTEKDLTRLVKRVIKEQRDEESFADSTDSMITPIMRMLKPIYKEYGSEGVVTFLTDIIGTINDIGDEAFMGPDEVNEQPSEWGRDSINRPGSFSNYIGGPGSIGNKDYDPEEKISRQNREDEEREERKYKLGFMDFKTGREWTEDGLRSYVKKKFDVDLPDEVFSGKGAIWANASNYLKNYFG
jgi:hypothetical protein